MVDIGYGFFMIKFDNEMDRDKVIEGGPWMVFDNCLAVQLWKPDFVASEVQINKTIVWIRFPSLGMEYYDESVLLALASAVGTLIRVDMKTRDASRGKYARVCVELYLISLWWGGFSSETIGSKWSMKDSNFSVLNPGCMGMSVETVLSMKEKTVLQWRRR